MLASPRARSEHLDLAAVEPAFQALGGRFLRARIPSATQPRLPYAVAHTMPLRASIEACWRKPSTMQPGGPRPKRILRLYPGGSWKDTSTSPIMPNTAVIGLTI